MYKLLQLVLLTFLFICNASVADVIVRVEIQQGTVIDNVDFRLYDGEAPVTVANFLNYVSDGDYDKSFIHRSVPGFIVQGGGFTFDPAVNDGTFTNTPLINDYPGGLQPVPRDTWIVNEFKRSNLLGTIAMAKVAAQFVEGDSCTVEGPGCTLIPGTGPDSATSQWFINLADNSANLDVTNGGYTVFGEVLNNGMTVIDTIASQPVYDRTDDIHTAFGDLPIINYLSDPIENNNLIKVNKINELFTITPDIDYGTVTSGSNVQPEITIKNTGNDILQLGGIRNINPVSDPFRILDSRCANSIIQPGGQCSFMVLFSPESEGVYMDSFNIEIANYGISYEVSLSGVGGPALDEPDIVVSFSSVDYGLVDVLDSDASPPYTLTQVIQNKGKLDLAISSIDVTGQDAEDINVSGNCIGLVALASGDFCSLSIEFKPLIPGEKYAEVSIISNDEDESPFIIPIRGAAAGEDDGVPAAIEDAGPNNGDGNNDDILDSKQSNVATLIDSDGNYVTYLTENSYRFSGMSSLHQSDISELPADVVIGSGVFNFSVGNIVPGELLEFGIILPANVVPSAYYMYGPTADNANPHWYRFDYDGETGAIILNGVNFTASDGRVFSRNVLKVIHKDGARGDSDMAENGAIAVTGGIPTTFSSDEGSGSISYILFLSIASLLLLTRNISHARNIGERRH